MRLKKNNVGRLALVLTLLVPICFLADSDLGAAGDPQSFELYAENCTAGGPGALSCSYGSCSVGKDECSGGKYPCCGAETCGCVGGDLLD